MVGPPSFPVTTRRGHSHHRYSSPLMRPTHRTGRPRDAPLRRTITLAQGVPQAMKNKQSHRFLGTFSKRCCTNGTNSSPRSELQRVVSTYRFIEVCQYLTYAEVNFIGRPIDAAKP